MYGRSEYGRSSEHGQSEEKLTKEARGLELGLALAKSDVSYSTAEGQSVEEFARTSDGELDADTLVDLLPFARVLGRERAPDEIRDFISKYGLEGTREKGRELREGQDPEVEFPSQALDAPRMEDHPELDPAQAFGPIVGDAASYQRPVINPATPWQDTFPPLPAMGGSPWAMPF
jgi:hypothetical protein